MKEGKEQTSKFFPRVSSYHKKIAREESMMARERSKTEETGK